MDSMREMEIAAETEGARRATGVSASAPAGPVPDPEVNAHPKRRHFPAEYKLRILREADACKQSGEIGALLRREGLFSSHLVTWRRERDRIARSGMSARKRGPKARAVDPRLKQLERENAKLRRRLEQVELMLDIQKKASELLGIPLKSLELDEND
jgi:transposase-like protein